MTWSRAELKTRAKSILFAPGSFFKAFLVCLIAGLLNGGYRTTVENRVDFDVNYATDPQYWEYIWREELLPWLPIMAGLTLVAALLAIFIFALFEVGKSRYFLESTQHRFRVGNILFGFGSGKYLNIVLTLFLRNLYLFLWSMLFVIPGVVKAYSYRMVPYLLAENPGLSASRAITISRNMMRGYKWRTFVLDLSFIGWNIVAGFAAGILLWVFGFMSVIVWPLLLVLGWVASAPYLMVDAYQTSTEAQLYLLLREEALKNNITNLAELNPNPQQHNPLDQE